MSYYDGLNDLEDEIASAIGKFPHGKNLVEALCEELGEAAREPDSGKPGKALEAPARRVLEGA